MFAPAGGNTLPEPSPLHHRRTFSLLLRRIQSSLRSGGKKKTEAERVGRWPRGGGEEAGEKKEEKMRQWVTRIQLEETLWRGTARQLIAMRGRRGCEFTTTSPNSNWEEREEHVRINYHGLFVLTYWEISLFRVSVPGPRHACSSAFTQRGHLGVKEHSSLESMDVRTHRCAKQSHRPHPRHTHTLRYGMKAL